MSSVVAPTTTNNTAQSSNTVVHVTDGYYRWSDIVWRSWWTNEYHRNAILALVHPSALSSPDHPLCIPGEDYAELYVCDTSDGGKHLCFSLRQIEYCLYYIRSLRLDDPVYLDYLNNVKTAPKGKVVQEPPRNDDLPPILLPSNIYPTSFFTNVQAVPYVSATLIKKLDLALRRHNQRIMKGQRATHIDPLQILGVAPPPSDTPPTSDQTSTADEPTTTGQPDDDKASAASVILEEPTLPSGLDLNSFAENIKEQLQDETNGPAAYYSLAQQALFIAGSGGVVSVFRDSVANNEKRANVVESESENGEDSAASDSGLDDVPEGLGRSLFLALSMANGKNGEVREVGYAAVWYAANPSSAIGDDGRFDECRESGHWMVEGSGLPSSRYLHGNTLPFPASKLGHTLNRKIFDLWRRAGSGPIYIITHSADFDYTALDALRLDVSKWSTDLDAGDFPSFASESALGKRYVIDTARLYGAVEARQDNDKSVDGVTTRSLLEVSNLILRPEGLTSAMLDNAGNRSALNMELFYELLAETTLEELRSNHETRLTFQSVIEAAKRLGIDGAAVGSGGAGGGGGGGGGAGGAVAKPVMGNAVSASASGGAGAAVTAVTAVTAGGNNAGTNGHTDAKAAPPDSDYDSDFDGVGAVIDDDGNVMEYSDDDDYDW